MDGRTMRHGSMELLWRMLFVLFIICLGSCKDDKDATVAPYDPNQPIEVTDFTPKSGGGKKKMIIYGSNFGTDRSIISVKVGGKEALVISSKGNSIYCQTPERCFEGTVEVKIGEQAVVVSEKYQYEPQTVVTDLCGEVNELGQGNIETEPRPFNDCGKIEYPYWFSFDPQHHHILYLSQTGTDKEKNRPLRVLDLEKEMIYTKKVNNIVRMTSITWTDEGNMVIACPQGGGSSNRSNIILKRGSSADGQDFKDASWTILTRGNACNGSMILPETGDIYFNHRATGLVYRYNISNEENWNANPPVPGGDGLSEILAFSVPNSGVDFSFVPHPTGKYVYIIMHESHYILRSNYDKETGKLVTPYIVCGQSGQADYKDLVGINARLNKPGQGVFVYNKEYEDAGKEDHYDFYFTDTKNHCIRKLTPDGVVSTFAGRGSASTSAYKWGKQNGEIRERARFNEPVALAYDEETKTFYVGDTGNFKIRKIAKEQEADEQGEGGSDDEQTGENQMDEIFPE